MDRATQLTIETIDELQDRDPAAAQAIADTILPCALRALYAAIPVFAQTFGQCLVEQIKQPGYQPKPDDRCNT